VALRFGPVFWPDLQRFVRKQAKTDRKMATQRFFDFDETEDVIASAGEAIQGRRAVQPHWIATSPSGLLAMTILLICKPL
jgi:hypothetical protein